VHIRRLLKVRTRTQHTRLSIDACENTPYAIIAVFFTKRFQGQGKKKLNFEFSLQLILSNKMSSEENMESPMAENVDESPTEPEAPPEVSTRTSATISGRKRRLLNVLDYNRLIAPTSLS
jgi:hypothetical protein